MAVPAATAPLNAIPQRDKSCFKLPPMLIVSEPGSAPLAGDKAVVDIVDDFAFPKCHNWRPDLRHIFCRHAATDIACGKIAILQAHHLTDLRPNENAERTHCIHDGRCNDVFASRSCGGLLI